MHRRILIVLSPMITACCLLHGQTATYPFRESFDTVAPPKLPAGWTTSTHKSPSGDFTTSATSPHSGSNDVVTTDARISQSLLSPIFNFEGKIPSTLEFYERRSSSYSAGVAVDALLDGDTASGILIGDSLRSTGTSGYLLRSLPLPASLGDRRRVQFRWRSAGDGTGSTGTMRIDDVSVTVRKQADLAVSSPVATPSRPRSGEDVDVRAWISNDAMGGTFECMVKLLDVRAIDSAAPSQALIAEEWLSFSLASSDSTMCRLRYPSISPGEHRLVVMLDLEGDEDTTNNSASVNLSAGYDQRGVVINEIMYAPEAGPEWIECINLLHDTLSLEGWKVGDATSVRVVFASPGSKVAPGEFFTITRDSSILSAFPNAKGKIFKAAFPSLNNDGDAVVVTDPDGFTVDSVAYRPSWGGTGGASLERIDTAGGSTDPLDWGSSRDPSGGTPGFVNSLTKKNVDISVERVIVSPASPVAGDPIQICAVVKNVGRKTLAGALVSFFKGTGPDSLTRTANLYGSVVIATLSPSDSLLVVE